MPGAAGSTERPARPQPLRHALDCLVAASELPRGGKLEASELCDGFRALLLALVAHGALRLAHAQGPYTASDWLQEIERRQSSNHWSALLAALQQRAGDVVGSLKAILDPVPLRRVLRHGGLSLDERRLPEFLALLPGASEATAFATLASQLEILGSIHELFLDLQLARKDDGQRLRVIENLSRRRSGSHFTPGGLCRLVAERALQPLLADLDSKALLALRVCDPAMGTGAFLIHGCEVLASAVATAWKREKHCNHGSGDATLRLARRTVIENCLYGVDRDPNAVLLARASLELCSILPDSPAARLDTKLRHGDALVGQPCANPKQIPVASRTDAFHWPVEFPEVFPPRGSGFDALLGNPPWVAYVGRAAQPLAAELARYYLANSPAFHGYRTLHGLFVHRAAQLLKPGGRLGLVIPTSVADLDGYAPTRVSLDALCTVDDPLPDFGDGRFPGVFQPCIALLASRRVNVVPGSSAPWTLSRDDLEPLAAALLQRLAALPPLPAELFGERGFQTTGNDRNFLRQQAAPHGQFTLPLSEGVDVQEFVAAQPSTYAAPKALTGRLRPADDWKAVALWIRQTARYPIAALGRGTAFRNSILAGFDNERFSAPFLLCYLNSDVIRWYHFMSRRDARQGMPQLKIGHLRRLPTPLSDEPMRALQALGRKLGGKRPPTAAERERMNTWACDALGLTAAERGLVATWTTKNPLPKSRRA